MSSVRCVSLFAIVALFAVFASSEKEVDIQVPFTGVTVNKEKNGDQVKKDVGVLVPIFAGVGVNKQTNGDQTNKQVDVNVLGGFVKVAVDKTTNETTGIRTGPTTVTIFGIPIVVNREHNEKRHDERRAEKHRRKDEKRDRERNRNRDSRDFFQIN